MLCGRKFLITVVTLTWYKRQGEFHRARMLALHLIAIICTLERGGACLKDPPCLSSCSLIIP